jgi:hypothetical protein
MGASFMVNAAVIITSCLVHHGATIQQKKSSKALPALMSVNVLLRRPYNGLSGQVTRREQATCAEVYLCTLGPGYICRESTEGELATTETSVGCNH